MSALAQLAVVVSLAMPGAGSPPRVAVLPSAPAFASRPAQERRPSRDAWFGDDKFRHFFMSFATTSLVFGGARLAGLDNGVALPAAVGVAAAAGLGKEFHDRALGRPFSVRDLVWDAAGIGAGALLLRPVR